MHKGADILRAREQAYGNNLNRTTVLRIIAPYGIVYLAFSILLFWNSGSINFFNIVTIHWMFVAVATLIGLLLGYFVLVPATVSINYYREGLVERHLFINNMTQAISSKSETLIHALHLSEFGLHGEFKQDISRLETTLENSGSERDIRSLQAFNKLRDKYHEDTYFCQYLEQVQSGFQTGKMDKMTCDDLAKFHNALFDEQQDYAQQRRKRMRGEFFFLTLMWFAYLFMVLIFGWSNYIHLFALHLPGLIVGIIFLIIMALALGWAYKFDHDESLLTL